MTPTVTAGGELPAPNGILHLHPSLRCNLSCGHCYSQSSPAAQVALDSATCAQVIADAAAIGCRVLSVSGGEPLLYPALPALLAQARDLGMTTQIVTNGWFLDGPALRAAAPYLDLVAISLDGGRERHNAMRGAPRAFARLEAGLPAVRALGLRFGFVHTVTAESWPELFDLADFAATAGATLLQLHPLEVFGRATATASHLALDAEATAKAYVVAALLRIKYDGRMLVHVDLLHRDRPMPACDGGDPLAALGILVVEADGTVVPLAYGFDRRFAICNLTDQRLADAWPGFVDRILPDYLAVRRALDVELAADDGPELYNWFELMVDRSRTAAPIRRFASAR